MRRVLAPLLALALMGILIPTAAAAPSCPKVIGFATITAHGDGTADGTAVLNIGGATYTDVTFTSTISGDQMWTIGSETVYLLEHAMGVLTGSNSMTINSTVEVLGNDSGSLTYRGLFDLGSLTGAFVVNGRLCIVPD